MTVNPSNVGQRIKGNRETRADNRIPENHVGNKSDSVPYSTKMMNPRLDFRRGTAGD